MSQQNPVTIHQSAFPLFGILTAAFGGVIAYTMGYGPVGIVLCALLGAAAPSLLALAVGLVLVCVGLAVSVFASRR